VAKTTAPLLSFGARGQIAKSMVMASWRGINYSRRYTVPADTPSAEKDHTRGVFKWLTQVWRFLPAAVQTVWTVYAKGRPFTDRNAWIKANLQNLRGVGTAYVTDIANISVSPGVNGGFIANAPGVVAAAGNVATCTSTAPNLPSGWSTVKAHYVGITDVDASTSTDYGVLGNTSVTGPTYPANISFGVSGNVVVSSFFEFTNAAGVTAYGPSAATVKLMAP
jgi:hypothetical protein